MSIEKIVAIGVGAFVILVIALLVYRRLPKRLKADYFMGHWKQLQKHLKDKKTWSEAIIEADKLLDRALKKRKFKGKSMGERMVAAQRIFSDNDGVWYAHNLSKKILSNDNLRLKEADVKDALICFRQALRDIGALPAAKEQVTDEKKS